jgi:hypothetical protein
VVISTRLVTDKETRRGGDKEKLMPSYSLSPCLRVSLSFFLLRLHQRPPAIVAAIGADHVRGFLRATLGARLELFRLESIVRTSHAGARIRLLALRYGHGSNLSEMLELKGFVESTKICRRRLDRQGRARPAVDWRTPARPMIEVLYFAITLSSNNSPKSFEPHVFAASRMPP